VHLEGTWLYGGTWFNHFGHFLTETITTLWPTGQFSGLLFHSFWFGSDVLPWQQAMLDLAGFDGLPVDMVDSTPTAVERLLVPVRPYIANAHAAPQAVHQDDAKDVADDNSGGLDASDQAGIVHDARVDAPAGGPEEIQAEAERVAEGYEDALPFQNEQR
jgi:hypothetical protein